MNADWNALSKAYPGKDRIDCSEPLIIRLRIIPDMYGSEYLSATSRMSGCSARKILAISLCPRPSGMRSRYLPSIQGERGERTM